MTLSACLLPATSACKLTGCNDCRQFTAETCECGSGPAECKMACTKEGTPCLNNGEDTSASECICKCVDGHKGHQCEITPAQYKNGIYLELNSNATDPGLFEHFWRDLKPALAKSITDYCKKNAKLCCGKEVDLGDSKTFPVDLKDPVECGMASDGKNLMIAVNPVVDSNNTLCGAAPAFSDGFIEGLKKFLIGEKLLANGWRTECHVLDCFTFLDFAKLKNYKTFVNETYKDKYKPGTGGGTGGGNGTNTGGTGGTGATGGGNGTNAVGGSSTPKTKSGVSLRSGLSELNLLALQVTLALLLAF